LVAWLSKAILKLGSESINSVKLYGKEIGKESADWTQYIELKPYPDSAFPQSENLMNQKQSFQTGGSTKALTKVNSNKVNQEAASIKKPIILITSCVIITLVISSLLGLSFWLKSTQTQTLAKAQSLINSLGDTDNNLNLDILRDTEKQLQKVVTILDNAPNLPLPGSIYSKITDEKQKIHTRLEAVEHNIKTIEKLLPAAKEVLQEFAALNSRLDVGMSYREYGTKVSDLKVALDRFIQEPGAENHPIYKKLVDAFTHYNLALDVWRNYMESDENNSFLPASSSYGNILISEYQVETQNIVGSDYIYLKTALSKIWQKASENVKAAQSQL